MAEPLSATQLAHWRTFIESSWALHTRLEDELRAATGLSMNDYHVLVALADEPGRRIRMGELASRLVLSPSRITYQISSMIKRGLVRKESCADDGRGQEAVLTDEGLTALREAAPAHLETVRKSFIDHLDDEELAVIGHVFAKIREV
ncbi:DNA-binding MarR family transcriptional regulator [Actinoplanes campanulatus]|uniref:DNA-binding MarR family transcriptional regulator n=1 Tax=Actinoplanes campanulatus TaxID=113559 RepID=A0A7W5AA47_9ACTN|nr:MarR family transcriptional regulator [Actinoplanes campanulatus]MBB3092503.1 DNA-binding MarR family transcriptional regulator [Actinoplanes campanulatus]GGM96971.1 MarR family transcriptional regulator [Actinoplanes campanulatus]GID34402.1 MarR family transcriptional regulator [Actinoplanes campanulatus]